MLAALTAFADEAYRNHRFDSFKVLETNEESIVFIGNSITDMHCWYEAFQTSDGNYLPIVNRGNSGTYSTEQSNNLESYLAGKPKKVFMMIGTNDIATSGGLNFSGEQVLQYVKSIVERIHQRSPQTKVYLYSILNNKTNNRVEATWLHTNKIVKEYVESMDADWLKYIDLYDKLIGIANNGVWSYDNLHLTAASYKVWCDAICEHLAEGEEYTVKTVYPDNTSSKQNRGNITNNNANAMRATYFSMLPVSSDDVLFFGDELVRGGEWQELLGNYNVKNRGTAWGYGGDIETTGKLIDATFANTGVTKQNPKAIIIYTGSGDCNGSTSIETIKTNYNSLVNKVKQKFPETKIYLVSLCPMTDSSKNSSRVSVLNSYMKTLEGGNVKYIDVYSKFVSGNVANSKYFYPSNYLGGVGYVVMANAIKDALLADFPGDSYNVISESEATKRHEQAGLRNTLTQVIARGLMAGRGDAIGLYDTEKMKAFDAELEKANALLDKSEITQAEVDEMTQRLSNILKESLSMPKASTDDTDHWYQFTTLRAQNLYLTAKGAATGVVGEQGTANSATSMWKFVNRGDDTYDIINRQYGSYLNPVATYNTQITTTKTKPTKGWTVSYSNTTAYYIISSGEVQLNQTGSAQGYKLYNWSNSSSLGNDRTDDGCQILIMEAADIQEPEEVELPTPVLSLNEATMSGSMPYQLTDEEAAKVFALQNYTVVLDVTLNSSMSGRGAFVCAANPSSAVTTTATPTSTPYFALGHYNANLAHLASTRDGDRFTLSTGALPTGQTVKIAFTANRTAKGAGVVTFYINGTNKGNFTYPLAGYEIPAFCDIKANHPSAGIYIGGGMAGNASHELCDATVHTAAFYGSALTDEQIAALSTTEEVEYASEVSYSTDSERHWYYIVSAASNAYCAGKAIQTNGDGAFTYNNVRLDPSMIWCFEKNSAGKVAIRNYNGKYMSKTQDKNHANAGLVSDPHYNYTITSWSGTAELPNAFTIKSDASSQPIHAQEDNVVIVTWQASNSNASLWSLRPLTSEELDTEISINSLTIEHSAMGVGIGGKDYALLRVKPNVTGLKGSKTFDAIGGSVNSANVENVRIYRVSDMFEYYTGKENSQLLGTATPDSKGNFKVTFDTPVQVANEASVHYWVVADIKETAQEGDIIDTEITSYTVNGKEQSVRNGNPANNAIVFLGASTVEYLNTHGSRYYRIPALTTAKNGWLVAVTDKRWGSNGDLPNNIDVVARVSKDNGATWSDPVTIAGTSALGGDYGHGDPAIVTDMVTGDIHVLVCSKEGFFYGTPNSPQLIKVITSHDNGETWDAPVDITNQLYGAGCSDSERRSICALFPSSGSFMQTRDGKLMCVAPTRPTSSTTHSTFQARIISSSDHGKTWTLSNNYAMLDADESKIVELDNGDLLVASRHAGNRYYAVSSNGGTSWGARNTWSELYEPGCNGDMIRLTSLSAGDDKNRLLHSIPNAGSRQNVTVFLSTDEGKSWPVKKSICPKGSAYSSLTVLPDGTIGCYYEEDGLEGGYQMRFVRFSLEWLTDGADSIESDNFGTAIEEVKTENENVKAIYDLQGRKVKGESGKLKGIYIIDGKKMFIK